MQDKKKFDIHERIFKFVTSVLKLTRLIYPTLANNLLLNQLIRSVTSTGANDQEADGVSTKRDFIHCYTVVRKEMKETSYWLKLLVEINPRLRSKADKLILESQELISIISSIIQKAKKD